MKEMNNSMLPAPVIPPLSCAHSLSLLPGLCEFVKECLRIYAS